MTEETIWWSPAPAPTGQPRTLRRARLDQLEDSLAQPLDAEAVGALLAGFLPEPALDPASRTPGGRGGWLPGNEPPSRTNTEARDQWERRAGEAVKEATAWWRKQGSGRTVAREVFTFARARGREPAWWSAAVAEVGCAAYLTADGRAVSEGASEHGRVAANARHKRGHDLIERMKEKFDELRVDGFSPDMLFKGGKRKGQPNPAALGKHLRELLLSTIRKGHSPAEAEKRVAEAGVPVERTFAGAVEAWLAKMSLPEQG